MQIAVLMCSRNLVNCVWPTNRLPCCFSIMEQEARTGFKLLTTLDARGRAAESSRFFVAGVPGALRPALLPETFKQTFRVWWSILLLSRPFNGSLMRLLKARWRFFSVSVITVLVSGCSWLHKWPSASFFSLVVLPPPYIFLTVAMAAGRGMETLSADSHWNELVSALLQQTAFFHSRY